MQSLRHWEQSNRIRGDTMRIILIEKLFGEHNIQIDLEKKLNIMIGENGIGKTTILNIIQLLYKRDFIKLTKYNFKRITLTTDGGFVEINQADLFPELKFMLNQIEAKIDYYDNNLGTAYDVFSTGLVTALKSKPSIYYEYLSSCFHGAPLSNRVKQNIDSFCYHKDLMLFDPIKELRSVMVSMVSHSGSYSHKEFNYFSHSIISGYLKQGINFKGSLDNFFVNPIVSLDMVNKYALKEDLINRPPIYSNMFLWLNGYEKIFYDKRFDESLEDFKYSLDSILDYKIVNSELYKIGLPNMTPVKYANEYISIFKKAYKDVEYNFLNLKRDINKIINEINNDGIIDVNGIINRFFFSEEFMKEINNKAISCYSDLIGEAYNNSDYIDAYREFNDDERFNIKNYIQPIILENTIFSKIVSQILNPSFETNQELNKLLNRFRKFYDENILNIINSTNPRVNEFERLLNEFVTSKIFTVTPSGLKVYLKKYKEYENGKFKVIENETNEIRLMDLSSGEKKLVIILLFSCIFDNLILLMDEPELSFSITWQEKILESIINQKNDNSYLIATHSPFIVTNEEIAESILPLPLED